MKQTPLRVSVLACVLSAVVVSGASAFSGQKAAPVNGQDERSVLRNQYGAVVRDSNGQRINYSREQLQAQALHAGANEPPSSKPPAGAAAPSTVPDAAWAYATLGSGIGMSNILIAQNGASTEIYTGAGFNSYWVALRYNSTTQDYDEIYVSSYFPTSIRRIKVADVIGDSAREIIVALDDGHINLYDQATKSLTTTITTSATNLGGMDIADVDGDGTNEIVISTGSRLYVYSGSGVLKWDLAGVAGNDLVVGQMDTDPAVEIALTDGHIVDCATHAVQWTWSHGFGVRLAAADIDGDGMKELIVAEGWQFVWAYDVDRQLPRWSISTSQDIGAILVTDLDGDGAVDLLVGQGQWGDVIVFDPVTQLQKGTVHNPEHGVTSVAVGDVDGDGPKDVLWGAGATSSGEDHLYVASWQTRQIKWENIHLEGPFIGPEVGDLDGDGNNELVVFAPSSDAGYSGGRILVFDAITRRLRAMSDTTVGSFSSTGDLKLRDVDGDARMDILVVGSGAIAIFGFDSSNTFTPKWSFGQAYAYSVDAADIDNDGQMEIVAGTSGYIYVYSFVTGSEEWHSLYMRGPVTAVGLADVNQDGTKELVGMVNNDDVYIFDGQSKLLEAILTGPFSAMRVQNVSGQLSIALGNESGDLMQYRYSSGSYNQTYRQRLINSSVNGFTIDPEGNVWIGSIQFGSGAGTLTKVTLGGATLATYSGYGPTFGLRVAFIAGSSLFFTTSNYAVLGFPGGGALPETIGIYLPSNTTFYLRNSNTPGFADLTIQYGPTGATPIVGDWDGNGTVTIGVFDPATATFYLRNSNTPGLANITFRYGPPGAIPIVGDWNGDGVTTIGVYDPSSRIFYLRNSNSAGFADITIQYGPSGATPIVGDWNGNGITTIGVYDPASSTFYLRNTNSQGFADLTIRYGPSGATPIVGDWNGDGTTTLGVYDPTSQTFYLRNSTSPGFADITIRYGPSGATPLAGDWNGL